MTAYGKGGKTRVVLLPASVWSEPPSKGQLRQLFVGVAESITPIGRPVGRKHSTSAMITGAINLLLGEELCPLQDSTVKVRAAQTRPT